MINSEAAFQTPPQVFSYEFWEIFKRAYFEEHQRTAAFVGSQ